MFWLSVAGGIFLTWIVVAFLFTPGVNYHLAHRTSIHAARPFWEKIVGPFVWILERQQ